MARKTYKNKGVPVKGSELRNTRSVRVTDSAWAGITKLAELYGISRGELIEYWMQLLTKNEEQFSKIAANEGMTIEQVVNKIWEELPTHVEQFRANKQQPELPLHVKLDEESQQ